MYRNSIRFDKDIRLLCTEEELTIMSFSELMLSESSIVSPIEQAGKKTIMKKDTFIKELHSFRMYQTFIDFMNVILPFWLRKENLFHHWI